MRVIITILLILSVSFLRAQDEITSFYFGEAQPVELKPMDQLDESICGKYLFEDDTLTSLYIEKDSIYTKYSVFTFLTKKELKKSDKYKVENELIYGIKKGQGLPYIERKDTLFTVIIQTETLFKPKENVLMKNASNYFLNFKEDNGLYSTQMLVKSESGIMIFSLDHEEVLEQILDFSSTETKKMDGFKTYISSPSQNEFLSFVKNKGFTDRFAYAIPENIGTH